MKSKRITTRSLLILVIGAGLWLPGPALAQSPPKQTTEEKSPATEPSEKPKMLVLATQSDEGIDSSWSELVESLLVSRLHAIGRHDIVSSADLVRLIGVAEQQQLAGCDEVACMAEVSGALGARWSLQSELSLLNAASILHLKLVDTKELKLFGQVSEQLPQEREALVEAIRLAAYGVLHVEAPPAPPPTWYKRPWVWGLGAAVVVGLSAGTYWATRPESAPDSALGTVALDG